MQTPAAKIQVQVQSTVSCPPAGKAALSEGSGPALGSGQRLQAVLAPGPPDLVQQLKVKRGIGPDEVVKPLSALNLPDACLVHEWYPGASSGQGLWSRADSWQPLLLNENRYDISSALGKLPRAIGPAAISALLLP